MASLITHTLRAMAGLAAPAGKKGRLSVLIYHRVLEQPDPLQPYEPDISRFRQEMVWLREMFQVLPLGEAVERLYAGTLPARAAVVTFDDGYACNTLLALPVLKELEMSATFFVPPGYLDGGRMWNDTVMESLRTLDFAEYDWSEWGLGGFQLNNEQDRFVHLQRILEAMKAMPRAQRLEITQELEQRYGSQLPSDFMMSSGQVRELHEAGMEVGSHTMDHPILLEVPDAEAERQIAEGKDWLEGFLKQPMKIFAYPNGRPGKHYEGRHVRMCERLGIDVAVTSGWGVAGAHSDALQIPRFRAWDEGKKGYQTRMLANLFKKAPSVARGD